MGQTRIDELLLRIRACRVCEKHLPLGVRPILTASSKSKIIVIGQAPGRVVHETGIPWNDKSGENLRAWMGVDRDTFYDANKIALIPMGFCYPGRGASGDLPPRKECAPLWHPGLMELLTQVELILLVGQYAQVRYLGADAGPSLTETVRNFHSYLPRYLPLPHPSPRNNIWKAKNRWFEGDVLPTLKARVQEVLG